MLRLALPPYRLPNEVVDDDVANVTDVGVKIVTDTRVEDLEALKAEGYDAVLLAIGTHQATRLRVPGEDLPGVMRAADFLKAAKLGEELDVKDKRVVVIGGGNVAIDVARTALRHGAQSVQVLSLESLQEMPAHPQEVEEARAEGVTFKNSCGVRAFGGEDTVRSVDLHALRVGLRRQRTLQSEVRRRHCRQLGLRRGRRGRGHAAGFRCVRTCRSTAAAPSRWTPAPCRRACPTCSRRATWSSVRR